MIEKKTITLPTDILYTQLGMPQKYKEALIEESYKLKNRKGRENRKKFKEIFNEDENSIVIGSGFKIWEESQKYDILLDNILKFVYSISPSNYVYNFEDAWLGIYDKGQSSNKHSHEPFYKSFCYYISAKEPYTPMVFDGVEINAITDRLIVFPSYLNHLVPPSNGGERIMIAGNILVLTQ
jgi:hypothetical protein